ncbi:MAG: hypothetical protein IT428_20050 [Planctomycetaceae bacterium]|nr:hypothetical protein [Planctomycetaceae bacterium]
MPSPSTSSTRPPSMPQLLPSARVVGGIAVVAAAVGLYLGTKLPGFGLGGGKGTGSGSPEDLVVSTEKTTGKRTVREASPPTIPENKPSPAGETKPKSLAAVTSLDVVIDGDGYQLRKGPSESDTKDASLDEILGLVRNFPPDKEGVRVRVFRKGTALPSAENRLQAALKDAGVPSSEVLVVKELID